MNALFGPAGNSESFYASGNKESLKMPQWLKTQGLDAYEYQCGNGVRIGHDLAVKLGNEAKLNNIKLSVHSPYYISLSTDDEEKRINSVDYIMQTLRAADAMCADRIVVHSGSKGKLSREEALAFSKKTLLMAQCQADAEGLSHIHICPETMGKINQIGTLDEVIELCLLDDRFLPTVDFGHLNARTLGSLKTKKDFEDILNSIENKLGADRLKVFHSHFSKIEYTKGGEKKHLTFDDTQFGPDFLPLAELIYKKNLSPVFICESAGTQTEDAIAMKKMYLSFFK